MKKVIITGGSTNEPVDEVMRLITMGTGSLSLKLANLFHESGWEVTAILNVLISDHSLPKDDRMNIVRVETTQQMMDALEAESKKGHADAVIHSAAVNDYKPEFEFLMEDMAEEIYAKWDEIKSADDILDIMTNPACKLANDSKISSYQENLTIKLGLTPKIIGHLREWYPDTKIFGFKLLEDVTEAHLLEVAQKLCIKNNVDYILANDLAKLRQGDATRRPVTKDGFTGIYLAEPEDIRDFVIEKTGA